jgi:hypothetical protein
MRPLSFQRHLLAGITVLTTACATQLQVTPLPLAGPPTSTSTSAPASPATVPASSQNPGPVLAAVSTAAVLAANVPPQLATTTVGSSAKPAATSTRPASRCNGSRSVGDLDPNGKATPDAPEGVVYFLPRVEYRIEVERRLDRCGLHPQRQFNDWLTEEVGNFRALFAVVGKLEGRPFPTRDEFLSELRTQHLASGLSEPEQKEIEALFIGHLRTPPGAGASHVLTETSAQALLKEALSLSLTATGSRVPGLYPGKLKEALNAIEKAPEIDEDQVKALVEVVQGLPKPSAEEEGGLKVAIVPTVTPRYVPDPSHSFLIRYAGLGNGMKETGLDLEKYANGTLKSLNSTIEDRTAEVIAGTVRGLVNIAALAGGFPVPAAAVAAAADAAEAARTKVGPLTTFREYLGRNGLCKPEVLEVLHLRLDLEKALEDALKQIQRLETEIRDKGKELEKEKGQLAATSKELKEAKEAQPPDPQKIKDLEAKVQELQGKVKVLEDAVKAAEAGKKATETPIAGQLKRRADLVDRLTVKSVLTLIPAQALRQRTDPGAAKAAKEWFLDEARPIYCDPRMDRCYDSPEPEPTLYLPLPLRADAAVLVSEAGRPFLSDRLQVTTNGHLVYREPAYGEVFVCKEEPCLNDRGELTAPVDRRIFSAAATVPQLGPLAVLPLTNGTFENKTLEASFAESGALQSFTYKTNAAAEKAANAFAESAETLSAFAQAKREAKKSDITLKKDEVAAETELLEAQLALEQARQQLEAFRRGEPIATDEEAEDDEAEEGGGEG